MRKIEKNENGYFQNDERDWVKIEKTHLLLPEISLLDLLILLTFHKFHFLRFFSKVDVAVDCIVKFVDVVVDYLGIKWMSYWITSTPCNAEHFWGVDVIIFYYILRVNSLLKNAHLLNYECYTFYAIF